jgi:uncharacterized protein YfcZ (UPF0381/DUF406 family)
MAIKKSTKKMVVSPEYVAEIQDRLVELEELNRTLGLAISNGNLALANVTRRAEKAEAELCRMKFDLASVREFANLNYQFISFLEREGALEKYIRVLP